MASRSQPSFNHVFQPPTLDHRCKGINCEKEGKLKCSRCLQVYYCSRECQLSHYPAHKSGCKKASSSSTPGITMPEVAITNVIVEDKVKSKALILSAISRLKKLKPGETADGICGTCSNPIMCISVHIVPSVVPSGTGESAGANFVCKNGHLTTASDSSLGTEAECVCEFGKDSGPGFIVVASEEAKSFQYTMPAQPRVLIVCGLCLLLVDGRLKNGHPLLGKISGGLRKKGVAVDTMVADSGEAIVEKIQSGRYSKIYIEGITQRGFQKNQAWFEPTAPLWGALLGWTQAGGKFLYHGEGQLIYFIAEALLGSRTDWHFCGDFYRRCKQSKNKECCSIPTERLPNSYSMKSTMLSGVAPEHQVYSPKPDTVTISNVPGFGGRVVSTKRTAVAAASCGNGIVMYIGDVNYEDSTIDLIFNV